MTTNVTFVTDSNHAANSSGEFAIWDLDQAYGRRWTRRVSVTGLSTEQEVKVLTELAKESPMDEVMSVVRLTEAIRSKQLDGFLQSILPPTIDAELDLLGAMGRLPLSIQTLVFNTLLGHCAKEDEDEAQSVLAEGFGVRVKAKTPAAEAVGAL